jgi:hypothetical protein
MLHVTEDVLEIRHWAERHGARPCRDPGDGRLSLALPGEPCPAEIGWDEFEPSFCVARLLFVYDDAPGRTRFFVGSEPDARHYVSSGEAASHPP